VRPVTDVVVVSVVSVDCEVDTNNGSTVAVVVVLEGGGGCACTGVRASVLVGLNAISAVYLCTVMKKQKFCFLELYHFTS
jgi:hypothetical protein